jgi:RNA polymerase sigma-70 factor, ECF subfamily
MAIDIVTTDYDNCADYNEDLSDARLVQRFRRGDGRSFDALLDRYRALFFSLIRPILGHEADVDDVFQMATFRIFLKLDTLEEPALFRPWACRIVTNCALAEHRRRRRRQPYREESPGEQVGLIADPSPGADDIVSTREILQMTESWMEQLTTYEREILLGYAVDGQTLRQAAESLRITTAAAKGHAFRARSFLRSQRQHHWGEQL